MSQSKAEYEYKLSKAKDNTVNGVPEKESIQREMKELDHYLPKLKVSTAVSLVCLGVSFVLYKSVLKENKEFKPAGTWNIK